MSTCYHPLKAIDLGINPDTGKHSIKVLKGEYSPSEPVVDGVKIIPIPCGRCIGCRLQYSREWADRCMVEAKYHDSNCFLTLTYDDSHLPECLPGSQVHPLVKRDLQLFMKRLRKRFPEQKIRFFACGEYGDPKKSFRPHYHIILFGLKLPDLKVRRVKADGIMYYTSETIDQVWNKGIHVLTDVTWNTCAYVARYVVKKQKGKNADVYDNFNYTPEFTLMSRKPGIGHDYFMDNVDIVFRQKFLGTEEGAHKMHSNRYFDKLFDIEYHDDLQWIKEDRVAKAELNERLLDDMSSLSYSERLHSAEITKESQIKSLKRKEV